MTKKFKLGQEVIFVESTIYAGDMDDYIGAIGIIESFITIGDTYDYQVLFGKDNESYLVRKDEIIKATKAAKVLYGL